MNQTYENHTITVGRSVDVRFNNNTIEIWVVCSDKLIVLVLIASQRCSQGYHVTIHHGGSM